jgi:serine/threonine-protein kinase RsbW
MNAAKAFGSSDALSRIAIALEELLLNIMRYAYGETEEGPIDVGCRLPQRGLFCFRLRDRGKAFDPLLLEPPDITLGIDERQIGGLGIYLVRQLADTVEYERSGGWNEFTCCFRNSGAEPEPG